MKETEQRLTLKILIISELEMVGEEGIRTLSGTLPMLRHRSQLFEFERIDTHGEIIIKCKNAQHCEHQVV